MQVNSLKEKSLKYYYSQKFFEGKGVIVTGATGGIGSVLTKALCDLGAKVVAMVKDEKKFRSIFTTYLNDQQSLKQNLEYVVINFIKNSNVKELFSDAMYKLGGKLDIMFLCHGKNSISEVMDTTLRDYDEIVNANTRSFMAMISLATPFLKLTKGNVVAISSLESYIPVNASFLNTVTKSMVNMLIQSSALELASFGVRINGVAPGITNTLHRVGGEFQEENNNNFMEKMGTYNLLEQKVIEPEDVVDTMLFLASDDAGFMTGEIIKIDNGYSLNHDFSFSSKEI